MHLKRQQKFLWKLAGFALIFSASMLIWQRISAPVLQNQAIPAFTADFELTDHRGLVQSDENFAGKWLLVLFGFTNCPDVCPTTLAEVATVMDDLGPDANKVQPIFITIDPDRDTPTALADYVPLFHSSILGLTGTPGQIARTSETFYIYYEKLAEATAPDGYTMVHSSRLFLFGPQGGYVKSFAYGTGAETILVDLKGRF